MFVLIKNEASAQFLEALEILVPDQIWGIQGKLLHGLDPDRSAKGKNATKVQQDPEELRGLITTISWLSRYYEGHHEPAKAIEILRILATSHPSEFTHYDFQRLEACSPGTSHESAAIYSEFYSLLKAHCDPAEMLSFLIRHGMLTEACSILLRHRDRDLFDKYMSEILKNHLVIDQETGKRLLEALEKKVYSMAKEDGRYRPDTSIAEEIDCIRQIHALIDPDGGAITWLAWFKKFWNKHRRLSNLKRALERKGLILKNEGPSKK